MDCSPSLRCSVARSPIPDHQGALLREFVIPGALAAARSAPHADVYPFVQCLAAHVLRSWCVAAAFDFFPDSRARAGHHVPCRRSRLESSAEAR